MKILITGGAGFIGSNVADAYLEQGHEVVIVDNLSTGKRENIPEKAKFYLMDIRSPLIEQVFAVEQPDIVNHHAAQMSVPASVNDPQYDADVNVKGLLNILQNCVAHQIKKVIFISSGGAVYGEAEEYPTTEDYIPKPLSPYAITKYVAEKYLYFYGEEHGLDYTILRYANIYGPRQIPHGEAGVVAIFANQAMQKEASTIFTYSDMPDGMFRDYTFVKDVVSANILALTKGSKGIYNIGTNTETSTKKLLETIYQALNITLDYSILPARPGDIRYSCLTIDKAREELGWEPQYSFAEGIKQTISFYQRRS